MRPTLKIVALALFLLILGSAQAQTSLLEVEATSAIAGELATSGGMPAARNSINRARDAANAYSSSPQANPYQNMSYNPPAAGMSPPNAAFYSSFPGGAMPNFGAQGVRPPLPRPGGGMGVNPASGRKVVPGSHIVQNAPKEGFVPDQAAQGANMGFNAFRAQQFDAAIDWYKRAKDNDARYLKAYNQVIQFKAWVDTKGLAEAKKIELANDPMKITLGMYFGWSRSPDS